MSPADEAQASAQIRRLLEPQRMKPMGPSIPSRNNSAMYPPDFFLFSNPELNPDTDMAY